MKIHKKRFPFLFILAVAILIFIPGLGITTNHFNKRFEELSDTDRKILTELDTFFKTDKQSPVWNGYVLEEKTILAVNGFMGKAFIVNPAKKIHSIFAVKIDMPEDYSINVYRMPGFSPALLQFLAEGNMNTIGKSYRVLDNEVYFTKYRSIPSLNTAFTSQHYITFLVHEAFHYYMQNNWAGGSHFEAELITEADIVLLEREYEILAKIQESIQSGSPAKELLRQYAEDYTDIVSQRIEKNPEYLKEELAMETAEGTAQYLGIKASEAVGYDYGIMYFDNAKNISFAEVIPAYNAGSLDTRFLANRMPYETGSLLCRLLDLLDVPDWQEHLNAQTPDQPVTLYSILKDFVLSS